MIKHFKPLALAVSGLALAFAAPTLAADDPSPEAVDAAPALWKVADDDTTIYLFGTVHALPENIDWYHGALAEAVKASDTLVTEIRMLPSDAETMQTFISTEAMLPEGETLRGLLDGGQRASYEAALAKVGLPPEAFDRFEPWYAAITLATLPLLKQGYSADAGAEKVLETQAAGKPHEALETIAQQLAIFDQLPRAAQLDFLVETAEGIDEIKPLLDRMVAEWAAGDADELARLMNEDLDDPVLAERLIYARNAAWARWIDARLDSPGKVFVAVGAGHLAGKQSVQDKLAELGIVTTRIQ